MDQDRPFERGELIVELPLEWRLLIEKLWATDEKSIFDFLPEIIARVKATKSKSVAEAGLATVLHSPKAGKIHHGTLKLLTPGPVIPGYLATKLFADAARLPTGKVRKDAITKFKVASRGKALTMEEAVGFFEPFEKENDEASAVRAKRARKKLNVTRRPGRSKKTGPE